MRDTYTCNIGGINKSKDKVVTRIEMSTRMRLVRIRSKEEERKDFNSSL